MWCCRIAMNQNIKRNKPAGKNSPGSAASTSASGSSGTISVSWPPLAAGTAAAAAAGRWSLAFFLGRTTRTCRGAGGSAAGAIMSWGSCSKGSNLSSGSKMNRSGTGSRKRLSWFLEHISVSQCSVFRRFQGCCASKLPVLSNSVTVFSLKGLLGILVKCSRCNTLAFRNGKNLTAGPMPKNEKKHSR